MDKSKLSAEMYSTVVLVIECTSAPRPNRGNNGKIDYIGRLNNGKPICLPISCSAREILFL